MSAKNLFFNLNDDKQGILRELAPGLSTQIFIGKKAMVSIVTLKPNAVGSSHSHPEEQWGIMLEGEGIRTQDGIDHAVKEGDFWCTPGGIKHKLQAGPKGARVLDFFAPPREEYRKPGSGYTK